MLWSAAVTEQRFNAVMEVFRERLTVTEVADRYGLGRDRTRHRSPLTIETLQGSGLVVSGVPERSGEGPTPAMLHDTFCKVMTP